jgi:hypothetical protein
MNSKIIFFLFFLLFQSNIFSLFTGIKHGLVILVLFVLSVAILLLKFLNNQVGIKRDLLFSYLALLFIVGSSLVFSNFQLDMQRYIIILSTSFFLVFISKNIDFLKIYIIIAIYISLSNIILFFNMQLHIIPFFERIIYDGNHYRIWHYNLFGAYEDGRAIWFFTEPSEYVQFITPAIILAIYYKKLKLSILFVVSMLVSLSASIVPALLFIILYLLFNSAIGLFQKILIILLVLIGVILSFPYLEHYIILRYFNGGEFMPSRILVLMTFFEAKGTALNNFLSIYNYSGILFSANLLAQILILLKVYFKTKNYTFSYIILFLFLMSFIKLNAVETIFYWMLIFAFIGNTDTMLKNAKLFILERKK